MFENLKKVDLQGKRVILRVDYNVPVENNIISDSTRIDESLPTIDYLLSQNCQVILISHFGRPKGQFEEQYSLKIIAQYLRSKEYDVAFVESKINHNLKAEFESINAKIIMLENIRFYKEEEENSYDFAKVIASLADVYINDAFGCCHRLHSSITQVPRFIPSYAGLLLYSEVLALKSYYKNSKIPRLAIIGGAKISTKINILNSLIKKVDYLFIGGAMANNFLYVKGIDIGNSLLDKDYLEDAKQIFNKANNLKVKIILPQDFVVGENLDSTKVAIKDTESKLGKLAIFDIGPKTMKNLSEIIELSNSIIWNGPIGAFEHKSFSTGSNFLANELAKYKLEKQVIVGGGDSILVINNTNNYANYTHVSTGGGAFLAFLEDENLPAFEFLIKHKA